MVRARTSRTGLVRVAFLTLAFLALLMRTAIPAGYMAAPTNDKPFAIVLCTGQGAVTVAPGHALPGHDGDAPASEKGKDSPCAFAGLNAAAVEPTLLAHGLAQTVAYLEVRPVVARDLAPGRGLSAPPPPSTGPPALLI